ncbi:hypothetical protein ABPG75_009917 [Micractinium tetrahymenae]
MPPTSLLSTPRQPEPVDVKNLNPKACGLELSPAVLEAEYAVRGAIALKASAYQRQLDSGQGGDLPFTRKPITFFRQVLSLCDWPQLLDDPHAADTFPPDAIQRAREYLGAIPGGLGAYSESKGAAICRQHVAQGIEARDGHPCDIDDLWLTDGASRGVHMIMRTLLRDEQDCILCPIPQYPLYSATITLYGGTLLPYHLDEERGWQASPEELQAAVDGAGRQGRQVRALVVINPGNPTGEVLDAENQRQLESLVLIADEVYATNIYAEGKQFQSFKKVLRDMGPDYATVALVSLNSTSKGFYGERGGYMELANFPPAVKEQLYKLASISLCPNLALVMRPPQPGDPSNPLYEQERRAILESLKRRAQLVVAAFRGLEGVTCNPVEGAMYAFPRLTLPAGAVAAAEQQGQQADFLYCMELLDQTGIVTVPGSGFGQAPGTYHLRTTILPPEEDMQAVSEAIARFHRTFLERYGGGTQGSSGG